MSAQTPTELDILLNQMCIDNASALLAVAELQKAPGLTGLNRGHLSMAAWSITASQTHLARVSALLKTPRED